MSRWHLVHSAAFLSLTLAAAYVHGHYAGRWGDSGVLAAASERVAQFPEQIGNWTKAEESDIASYALRFLELRSYAQRVYVERDTGERVLFMLTVGPSGPTVRHPPEVCYQVRANQLEHQLHSKLTDAHGRENTFRVLHYAHVGESLQEKFIVAYALGKGAEWSVPELPRVAFAGAPLAYRIQCAYSGDPSSDADVPPALDRFLREFLVVWNETEASHSASVAK